MERIKLVFVIFLTFSCIALNAQKAEFKKANKAYKSKEYAKAIPFFQEGLAIKGNLSNKTKLANCYRMTNQSEAAENLFREIVRDPKAKPITYFYFGEALMSSSKYDEAKYWFQQYQNLKPDDPKVLVMIAACNQVKEIKPQFPNIGVAPFAHNSDGDDSAPVFWNNAIVFSSDRDQGLKLMKQKSAWTGREYIKVYHAKEKENFTYGEPKSYSGKVNEMNKNSSNITFSKDGTVAVFSRNSKNPNKKNTHTMQLFQMESTDGVKWKKVKEVSFCNVAYNYMHPALSPDGKSLYFVSDKGGGNGGTDIYVSHFKKDKWSRPENLGSTINTASHDGFPFVDTNGKLYFCSKGHAGFGGFDIFSATKDPVTEAWDLPVNVGAPVNSAADDISIFIDQQTRRGLFTSNRDGGDDDIYLFWLDGLPADLGQIAMPLVETETETETETEIKNINISKSEMKTTEAGKATTTDIAIAETPKVDEIQEVQETVQTITQNEPPKSTETAMSDTSIEVPESLVTTTAEISQPVMDNPAGVNTSPAKMAMESTVSTSLPTEEDIIAVPEELVVPVVLQKIKKPMAVPATPVVPASPAVSKEIIAPAAPIVEKTKVMEAPATDIKIPTEEIPATTPTIPTEMPDKTQKNLPQSVEIETNNNSSTPQIIANEALLVRKKQGVDVITDQAGLNSTADNPAIAVPSRSGLGINATFSQLKKDLKKEAGTAGMVYRLEDIKYEAINYLVSEETGKALDKVKVILEKNPSIKIELISHTYSVGKTESNLKLSKNRAKTAKKYLTDSGIAEDRITAIGYGEQYILNHCTSGVVCTQEEHKFNERLEVKVISKAGESVTSK